MKITVKNLKGTSFQIEAEPHHTVADLKQKIENAEEPHKYPAARQMLIHDGKVLKDETTLEENNVDENRFVVVMLSPNRSSSAGETSTAAEPVVPVPERSCTPAPPPSPEDYFTTAESVASSPTPISVRPIRPAYAAYALGLPNKDPLNLFPRDLADTMNRATRSADLDVLRNSARFHEFRSVARTHPQVVQIWYDLLRDHHPWIYTFIRERQVEFDALMNEGREFDALIMNQGRRDMDRDRVGNNSDLTAEEWMAVIRLQMLGFDRSLVIQVYLACDKNEQLAANYLLDHAHDDD